MPTSKSIAAIAVTLVIGGAALLPREAASDHKRDDTRVDQRIVFVAAGPASTDGLERSLERGLEAYNRGDYKTAIKALEAPAAAREFMAQLALAQIYADNSGSETDHAKAYMLYQSIADEYSDVDPDDTRRAPFVARALTTLAGYLLVGIPQIGVVPDPERAADYLHHAALFFGYEDAQFELVKLKLKGDGLPTDVASAKHWLSVLTQRGHAGAQAFLADLYWRGKIMEKDPVRAMALIAVAVENAPMKERIWIEDVYQNIYCGAGEGVRKQATGIVAEWRTRYGRKPDTSLRAGLTPLDVSADRSCQNGEPVNPLKTTKATASAPVDQPTGAPLQAPSLLPLPLARQPTPLPTPTQLPSQSSTAPPLLGQAGPLAQTSPSGKADGVRDIGVTAR